MSTVKTLLTLILLGVVLTASESSSQSLTADAGGPYAGEAGEAIQLDGTAVGGTGNFTYFWESTTDCTGPNFFSDPNIEDPTFTHEEVDSLCILELTVCDNGEIVCVPEPSFFLSLATGLGFLALVGRHRTGV